LLALLAPLSLGPPLRASLIPRGGFFVRMAVDVRLAKAVGWSSSGRLILLPAGKASRQRGAKHG